MTIYPIICKHICSTVSLQVNSRSPFWQIIVVKWESSTQNPISLPNYHIKHMPQILLILALQNTDMLRLHQFQNTEAPVVNEGG